MPKNLFFNKIFSCIGRGSFLWIKSNGRLLNLNFFINLPSDNLYEKICDNENIDTWQQKDFSDLKENFNHYESMELRPETLLCEYFTFDFNADFTDKTLLNFSIITNKNLILIIPFNESLIHHDRAWMELRCFNAGFRLHPRSFHLVSYEERENNSSQIIIALEKIPFQALSTYPFDVLQKNRLLHMDMLRESGRRGDAHCVRYHMAAEYIRPGDTILDVACGLGYGSSILYQNSLAYKVLGVDASQFGIEYAQANYGIEDKVMFRLGDAQNLDFLPDNSVDFITSFETIEHLPNPSAYLKELYRVLRPSGRLMISAPNDWTDETGTDPNPYHFHVYTWERLKSECKEHFLLEKGFIQTAGGAMKCHHARRIWSEVPLNVDLAVEAEWVLLLCMSDPVTGRNLPYNETSWELPRSPDFNVSAFARDYLNPWLVKSMIAIGMRSQSAENLNSMQKKVLSSYPPDSVDYGAALCGRIYNILGEKQPDSDTITEIANEIKRYASISEPTPHQLRWQVSLLFAGGELSRIHGKMEDARTLYLSCADLDVMQYSPLLGNKTLDALYNLSLLALQDDDKVLARDYLIRSVKEAQRLISGSWLNVCGEVDHPLTFGFPEMAQIMDKASRAAYMLYDLDNHKIRPGKFYNETKGYYERILHAKNNEVDILKKYIEFLTKESKNRKYYFFKSIYVYIKSKIIKFYK